MPERFPVSLKLIVTMVIINGIAALSIYKSSNENVQIMPYSFGTILEDKLRLSWAFALNLVNFGLLAAYLLWSLHN
jgi:hypothetical protein